MHQQPATVCILGAGPAGIAAAYFAQRKGLNVILVEEKSWVGGKGASRRVDDFIFDFGPHAYHPKGGEVEAMVRAHAGDGYLRTVARMDLILKGKHMSYPFKLKEGLLRFNPLFSLRILLDYIGARLMNTFRPGAEGSFRAWGLKHYGRTLYELCFGNYTERVWKISATELSVELARRKLPKFSIRGLLHDLVFGKGKLHSHIFTNELGYHREGIGQIYQAIAEGVAERGGQVLSGSKVAQVRAQASGGFLLEIEGDKKQTIRCDYLISAIPLPALLASLARADARFSPLVSRVAFRHIVLVYAVLDIPKFSAAHWTYLVDDRFNFHRISEQKNLSARCAPEGQTVLTLEVSCREDEPMWTWQPEQFREMVTKDLSFFKIDPARVVKLYVARLEDAYPIYPIDFEKELGAILQELAAVPGLVTTGRQGLFLDIDMHDAMVLGKNAVEALLEGTVASFYSTNSNRLKPKA